MITSQGMLVCSFNLKQMYFLFCRFYSLWD